MYSLNIKCMWATYRPGCLIILVDQSSSMNEVVSAGTDVNRERVRKADLAATVVNDMLIELQRWVQVGTNVRPIVDVCVIGYGPGGSVHNALGGNLANYGIVSIADLAANPLRVNRVIVSEFNMNTGDLDQVPMDVPTWVEPIADNGAPMCMALQTACNMAQDWVANNHTDNFPPIVVNVTGGTSTDGNPFPYAKKITEVATTDGNALLFNCYIAGTGSATIKYPHSIGQVAQSQRALQLFLMTSVIPQSMLNRASWFYGVDIPFGARGLVSGIKLDLTRFLQYQSMVGISLDRR